MRLAHVHQHAMLVLCDGQSTCTGSAWQHQIASMNTDCSVDYGN